VVLPFLLRKDLSTLRHLFRLWIVVLSANLMGTFLFAPCVGRTALFDANTQERMAEIGAAHSGGSIGVTMVRAIFAGWLIALMVWLLPGAESARASIIIIVTYLVGVGGFNHIVAGSTTMFFLIVTKSLSRGTYLTKFFLSTLVGNIMGGSALVAALGHAQVVGGGSKKAN
jgi:formate/nitrite transporter FocA (FNT family)